MSDLIIVHDTSEFRGDHAADVSIAIRPIDGETVADLVKRVNLQPGHGDCIRIRLLPPPAPAP